MFYDTKKSETILYHQGVKMIDFNYTILIQFANFLVLLILLNFLLFKPVLKALSKREKTIGSFFEKAQ